MVVFYEINMIVYLTKEGAKSVNHSIPRKKPWGSPHSSEEVKKYSLKKNAERPGRKKGVKRGQVSAQVIQKTISISNRLKKKFSDESITEE